MSSPAARTPMRSFARLRGMILPATLALAVAIPEARAEWRSFTTAEGLPDNVVETVAEDCQGRIWGATRCSGLFNLDGVAVRTVRAPETDLCPNANAMVADDGCQMIVTRDDHSHSMALDRRGRVWDVGDQVRRRDSGGDFQVVNGLPGFYNSVVEDGAGGVWLGGDGVVHFGASTFTVVPQLASLTVRCLARDSLGYLWIGTDAGAVRFDNVVTQTFTTNDPLASNQIKSMTAGEAGEMWFATPQGLSRRSANNAWYNYSFREGLPIPAVHAILRDRRNAIWLAGEGALVRFTGLGLRILTTSDGLPDHFLKPIGPDRSGGFWATLDASTWVFERGSWREETGLAGRTVFCMLEDSNGAHWVGTDIGLLRTTGTTASRVWTLTPVDTAPNAQVRWILEDRAHALWFATDAAVSRFNGTWRTFPISARMVQERESDGRIVIHSSGRFEEAWHLEGNDFVRDVAYDVVGSIAASWIDRRGVLWLAGSDDNHYSVITAFDSGRPPVDFRLPSLERFPEGSVADVFEDPRGTLWARDQTGIFWFERTGSDPLVGVWHPIRMPLEGFGPMRMDDFGNLWLTHDNEGVRVFDVDRTSPATVLLSAQPPAVGARTQRVAAIRGFDEPGGFEYSQSLLGPVPPDAWSANSIADLPNLADGPYTFRYWTRDAMHNVDPLPATWNFEVDATPPLPSLSRPSAASAVSDTVTIRGRTSDSRFASARLEFRNVADAAFTPMVDSVPATEDAPLFTWDVGGLDDGDYELRLTVTDSLGLVGVAQTPVVVDNEFPRVERTSPVRVIAAAGGDVFTTHQEIHLFFPPGAFPEDATVTIDPSAVTNAPAGATVAGPAFSIAWTAPSLGKTATLDWSWRRTAPSLVGSPVLHRENGEEWEALGGTVDLQGQSLSAPLTQPGRYALFVSGARPADRGPLTKLSLSPRVFSPSGSLGVSTIAIGFTLGSAGPVSVRVFSRAGRLVREVVRSQAFGPGAQLVRWDGRDVDGKVVEDGLYIVSVEASGGKSSQALSVVR